MSRPRRAGRGDSQNTVRASATSTQPASVVPSPVRAWVVIAIIAATCLAYSPALEAPFQLDDVASISDNVTIRRLWPPSIALRPPPGGAAVSGRPVANLSLALNYALNERLGVDQRPDPDGRHKTVGYHVANLLLHLACGALLFGIVRRTLRHG